MYPPTLFDIPLSHRYLYSPLIYHVYFNTFIPLHMSTHYLSMSLSIVESRYRTVFGQEDTGARWLLAGVVALTLLNSGVSVAFSYIGRDFWTALSNKDPEQFNIMLQR